MTGTLGVAALACFASYLVGSIPWAYIIVKRVTGEDVTAHGTGNVGAMNVRRTTGSWGWFTVAMAADALKGIVPVVVVKLLVAGVPAWTPTASLPFLEALPVQAAVLGTVLGHNYSVWMAIGKRSFVRTGKGLATGGGAVLAYDWRYCAAVVIVGLAVIAITKYMMAGQVAAAFTLPVAAGVLRAADWPFALGMGLLVYVAHHKRFIGLLQGHEPKLYIKDSMGPRG
ncbi:MAG: glycerol-3-phosphate acyltransferase [Coriobacteriia bacterium]